MCGPSAWMTSRESSQPELCHLTTGAVKLISITFYEVDRSKTENLREIMILSTPKCRAFSVWEEGREILASKSTILQSKTPRELHFNLPLSPSFGDPNSL